MGSLAVRTRSTMMQSEFCSSRERQDALIEPHGHVNKAAPLSH